MHLWLSKGAIQTHWMASGVFLTALSLLLYRLLFKSRGPFQFLRFGRGSGLHHHHHATERNLTPGGGHGKNGFSQILGLKPSPKADWLLLYLCSSLPSFSFLFFLSFFFYIRWQCEFFFLDTWRMSVLLDQPPNTKINQRMRIDIVWVMCVCFKQTKSYVMSRFFPSLLVGDECDTTKIKHQGKLV